MEVEGEPGLGTLVEHCTDLVYKVADHRQVAQTPAAPHTQAPGFGWAYSCWFLG